MSNMPENLSYDTVEAICTFIKNEKLDSFFHDDFPLGRRIFDIIEKKCVVVFYPIMDVKEKNDGFLMTDIPLSNGKTMNIIYINTFQTEEKQVFAAAHELGHFLRVEDYVREKCKCSNDSESIVNRFAAELLMPKEHFRKSFLDIARSKESSKHSINNYNMLECIVEMMDKFSVPYNTTVIRLVETDIISREDGIMLVDGNMYLPIDDTKKIVKKISSSEKYGNLNSISKKCEIKGLDNNVNLDIVLEKAEEEGIVSKVKIRRLREEFGIVSNNKDVFKNTIKITEE